MLDFERPLDWKVLLIGGNSGSGKTSIAGQLARRFGVALAEVDDFRLVLARMTTPKDLPAIHGVLADGSQPGTTPQAECQVLIDTAAIMSQALEIVVANHVNTNAPIILEGDGITPAFAAQQVYANLDTGNWVKAVFLIEDDEEQLYRNAIKRKRGFEQLPSAQQQQQVQASWLYGQWLQQAVTQHDVLMIAPCPWATLEARIVEAIK